MIKKALFITLTTMLGACSNSDDAGRAESSSNAKKTSSYQSRPSVDTQHDAVQNDTYSADTTQSKRPIVDQEASEQDLMAGIETITEDDFEDTQAEPATKFTVQGTDGQIEWKGADELSYNETEMVIVTPNGERITRKFVAGQPVKLEESLPDGLYKWESTVTPEIDPYVKEELRSVRESGDLQAQEEMKKKFRAQGAFPSKQELKDNRQSGGFVVRDGIAIPTTTESSGPDERG